MCDGPRFFLYLALSYKQNVKKAPGNGVSSVSAKPVTESAVEVMMVMNPLKKMVSW